MAIFIKGLALFLALTIAAALARADDLAARRRPVPPGISGNIIKADGSIALDAPPADSAFYFHDLGHRCADFGGEAFWTLGGPVYVYSCNGTIAQQVRVKEIDDTHDVELRVRELYCIGVKGHAVAAGQPLELQTCDGSPAQRFALDGDSILMGAQKSGRVTREFALETDHRRTPNRTPLVVASRDLSDAQYFRYQAVDKSAPKPTNGFLGVATEAALEFALSFGWGTVVEVDDRAPIMLKLRPLRLHEGVTLRGYRKYTSQGPEIRTCETAAVPSCTPPNPATHTIELCEPEARITGLRLRGPTSDPACTGMLDDDSHAIYVDAQTFPDTEHVMVDHVDLGYWHGHGIDLWRHMAITQDCPPTPPPFPRSPAVLAVDNFVHHNTNYGFVTGSGAFLLEQGNVFYRQGAHSMASDGMNLSGFMAYDNLVLQETAVHDIDMHGSVYNAPDGNHWEGGVSGDYFDIGWNTILPFQHNNIDDRGTPCRFNAIHDNVFTLDKASAIENHSTTPLVFWDNHWKVSPNPMIDLAVGDFDGDGIDDVFVGTGAGWYFSSGGQAEWRFLNRMPEHASQLLFGDFDGDGRTDVIAIHGANVDVSWGGLSPWQTINDVAFPIDHIAVGDFDGDHVSDLFLSTGAQWFYAPGGRNWTPYGTSSYTVKDLRFGDFTHEGHTEILRIGPGHQWLVVREIEGNWQPLGDSRDASLPELVVGDFDGDGFADVARANGTRWEFTSPGRGPGWVPLWSTPLPLISQVVGRFDGNATSDVITWQGRDFDIVAGGKIPPVQLSRQDMQ
jgi:hypothetical protein